MGATFPFKVAVCQRCGHVFGWWQNDRTHLYADSEYVTCETDLEQYSAYVSFVLAGIGQGKRRPRVLEIGFNRGALLKRFYDLGFECHGVEPGPRNVRAAQVKMPHAHLDVGLFDADWMQQFKTGYFDVVMLTSVLEHLPEPSDVLRAIRSRLDPGGRLFIVVPDLCFCTPTYQIPKDARERYGCSQLLFFYRNLFLCYAQHINHFSGPSLTRFLAALGLQTTQIATIAFIWVLAAPAEADDPSFRYPDLVDFHMGLMDYYGKLLHTMRQAVLGKLNGRRLVCYGAGRDLGYFLDIFAPLGVEILAVADDAAGDCRLQIARHDSQSAIQRSLPCVRPEQLASYNPEVCLATSFDFEDQIAAKAKKVLGSSVEVLTLTGLISEHQITIPRLAEYRVMPAATLAPTACG